MLTAQKQQFDGQPKRRRRFGVLGRFTLAEALIAFAATMVVLGGAMALFRFYGWLDNSLDSRNAAVNVAKSRIEVLRTLDYADLILADESETRVDLNGTPAADGALYRTTDVTPDPANTFAQVTVTVRIAGKLKYPDQSLTLATYIMDRSLVTNMQ